MTLNMKRDMKLNMNLARIIAITTATVFALGFASGSAMAQSKSLREQIVGTWQFIVAEISAADGKKSFPFGETPKGILMKSKHLFIVTAVVEAAGCGLKNW